MSGNKIYADVRRTASYKAIKVGTRYTCVIDGREIYFMKITDMLFVEGRAGA